jgi:SAM-dependent methyltransferase
MEQGEYRSYRAVHPFDERFGVDTSGLIYELASGHQNDAYNNGYFAVAPSVFHSVMQAVRDRLALDYRRFSFVDVGSGKGRALLLASDYPFREIIGVELSPEPTSRGMPAHAIERRSARSRATRPRTSGRPFR